MRFHMAWVAVLFTAVGLAQTPVEKSWAILEGGLADKGYEKRMSSAHALAMITSNPKAVALAEKSMGDERSEVRSAAIDTLGLLNSKSSIPKIKAAIQDKSADVVLAAANALYRMGDPSAYGVYYAVLTGEKKSGEGLVESQMKMLKDPKAMAMFGFEQGIGFIPFAGAGYTVFKMVTKDDASPVRAASAIKLASDPDPKSGQALVKMTADEKWLVRAAVVSAIAKRGDPALLANVLPLLEDKNSNVQLNAAAAVVHLSSIPKGKAPAPKK